MRVGPHHHQCQRCGTKTECCGELCDNYDGEPFVICLDFHLLTGSLNPDFICEGCEFQRQDEEAAGEGSHAE